MNLTEMVDALVTQTSLVNKRNEFIRRVREAITAVHTSAFFQKDVVEDWVDLSINTHKNFQIPLPIRHRKFKSIVPTTAAKVPVSISTKDGRYRWTDSARMLDYYGDVLCDTYYIAGTIVNISSSVAPVGLYMAWYELPEVADPYLETWLMEVSPQIFMDWALARFYKVNGRENIARAIESTLYSVDLQAIINSNATNEEL